MCRYNAHTSNGEVCAWALIFALIFSASPSLAQTADFSLLKQPAAAQQPPVTLTLKDALAGGEKRPFAARAASDAATALEDRMQARAAIYPSLSGKSEYLGTQGNGKLAESRFVTMTVSTCTATGLSSIRTLARHAERVAVQRASAAEALARAKMEIARRASRPRSRKPIMR